MELSKAKELVGKKAEYMNIPGTIIRVCDASDEGEDALVICEMDSGVVVNIDLINILHYGVEL